MVHCLLFICYVAFIKFDAAEVPSVCENGADTNIPSPDFRYTDCGKAIKKLPKGSRPDLHNIFLALNAKRIWIYSRVIQHTLYWNICCYIITMVIVKGFGMKSQNEHIGFTLNTFHGA
eukprot:149298_1